MSDQLILPNALWRRTLTLARNHDGSWCLSVYPSDASCRELRDEHGNMLQSVFAMGLQLRLETAAVGQRVLWLDDATTDGCCAVSVLLTKEEQCAIALRYQLDMPKPEKPAAKPAFVSTEGHA